MLLRIRPLTFLMFALASFRLTHLVVFDAITEFLRAPFLREKAVSRPDGGEGSRQVPKNQVGYLLTCYWCAGIWSSAGLLGLRLLAPRIGRALLLVLSISGAQALLEALIRFSLRSSATSRRKRG